MLAQAGVVEEAAVYLLELVLDEVAVSFFGGIWSCSFVLYELGVLIDTRLWSGC